MDEETDLKRNELISQVTGVVERAKERLNGAIRLEFHRILAKSTRTPDEHRMEDPDKVKLWPE